MMSVHNYCVYHDGSTVMYTKYDSTLVMMYVSLYYLGRPWG